MFPTQPNKTYRVYIEVFVAFELQSLVDLLIVRTRTLTLFKRRKMGEKLFCFRKALNLSLMMKKQNRARSEYNLR
jgi:hypothetical protein